MTQDRRSEHGFTLVEITIAVAILFIVLLAATGAYAYAARSNANNAQKSKAMSIANQRMEQARNLPYDQLGVTYTSGLKGEPPGSILTPDTVDGFRVETRVSWAKDTATGRAMYKTVRVTVSWTSPTAGSVRVSSNIFGSSSKVNTGDAEITVLDPSTGEGVPNATVKLIDSAGVLHSGTTDADGTLLFGFLPIGEIDLDITADGYAIDMTPVAGATIAADALTRLTVYAIVPSSATVSIVNDAGSAIAGATVIIEDAGGTRRTANTGVDGRVTFDGLMTGDYTVHVTAPGYSATSSTLSIASGGSEIESSVTMTSGTSLMVHVIDGAGAPIQGASVAVVGPAPANPAVSGSPKTTGADGNAAYGSLTLGTYTVTVTKQGYGPRTASAVLDEGSESVTMILGGAGNGGISISAVDFFGNPAPRVIIRVRAADGTITSVTTDDRGAAALSNLPPGLYTILTARSSTQVEVTSGVTASVTVTW